MFPLLSNAVFQDLRDSGRLQLIRDPELRRGIMQHYGRLEGESGRLVDIRDRLGSGLASLLARRIPPRLVIRERTIVSDPNAWRLDPGATPADVRAAAQALSSDPSLPAEIRAEVETLERERFIYGRMQDLLDTQEELLGALVGTDN